MQTAIKFQDLEIWQLSIELVKYLYQISADLPESEKYNLTSQMRRSAISVPSNIAEGFRRNSSADFKRFLNIAVSSLAELETQAIIAHELSYISEETRTNICRQIDLISRKIFHFIRRMN